MEKLFDYNAFPNPNLSPIPSDVVGVTNNLLGRTFEFILQLVIERQNPNFEFETPFRPFGNSTAKKAREIKGYLESGELTDGLIDLMISLAQERQKSFQLISSRAKPTASDGLKDELRRLHKVASNTKWVIKNSFYKGWLTDGRSATAEADMIIDASLIEIKTVKDTRKHDEHLSQLFSYFLLSQAPMRKNGALAIGELGIYYARHGKLIKQNVSTLVRFPLSCVKRVAFGFVVEFLRYQLRDDDRAIFEALKELHPRPEWFAKILQKRQANSLKAFKSGVFAKTPRIVLPKDFLL